MENSQYQSRIKEMTLKNTELIAELKRKIKDLTS